MPATYTSPKTMTNEPTLYADWNTYVRDNILYLKSERDSITASAVPFCKSTLACPNNTITETTVDTFTLAANYLYGGSAIHAVALDSYFVCINSYTGAVNMTLKLYYGATSVSTGTISIANGSISYGFIARGGIWGYANGSQILNLSTFFTSGLNPAQAAEMSASIDSTTTQTVKLTMQFGAATTNMFVRHMWSIYNPVTTLP